MDLSSQFKHASTSSTVFSPDGALTLSSTGDRLVLRDATSLELRKSWKPALANAGVGLADSTPPVLRFSPCSRRFLACYEVINTVLAFTVDANEEIARITAGPEGCKGAAWLNDVSVGVWSDHGLRLTIWSLAAGTSRILQWPLLGPERGWALRPSDSRYFAIVERHEGRDTLSIYDGAQNWQLARHFGVATSDCRGLSWSPCSRYLAVWDSPLEYALHIYAPDGRQLASFTPYADETSIAALGIRSVAWHPTEGFLAVAGFDGKIRILNDLAWTSVSDLTLPNRIAGKGTAIFQEPADWIARTRAKGIIPFEVVPSTRTLPAAVSDGQRTKAQIGISHIRWSPSGAVLAAVSAATPACVHLFTFAGDAPTVPLRPRLHAVIVLVNPVVALEWQPARTETETLAISSGSAGVCLWNASDSGIAEGMGVPSAAPFNVRTLTWSSEGSLLLADRATFCMAYPVEDA